MTYKEFLATKEAETIYAGLEVDRDDLNNNMFEFQKDIIKWALKKGRACVFSDCGTGKSIMQLEFADKVSNRTGCKSLIVAPLAVVAQTKQEGEKFGFSVTVCRSMDDVKEGVNITNYEMLSHFDADAFGAVVLDESSILKSFTSSTRNQLIDQFQRTPYRLCCTATPSPNDFTELGNHVEFLGIMSRSEMLATYFTHDSGDTSKWRLKGHGESKFWEWVATWAVCVRSPEDLGYSAEGYELPALEIVEHVIKTDPGNFQLFVDRAETLSERREARKQSIVERVEKAREITEETAEQYLVWCDYNAESAALHEAIEKSVEVVGADSPEYKAQKAIEFSDGDIRVLVSKPSIYGFGMNWQNCHNVIFCGLSDSYEQFYQAVRRCWRYGQEYPVKVHVIVSDKELNVLDNVKKKQRQMDEMQGKMVALMRNVTMAEIMHTVRITETYEPKERMELPAWIS